MKLKKLKYKTLIVVTVLCLLAGLWLQVKTDTFNPACCHKQCHGGCWMATCVWHEFERDVTQFFK